MSRCVAEGRSVDGRALVLKADTVGSERSSATHGSSTLRVAGKNRLPTKQWADASDIDTKANNIASTSWRSMNEAIDIPPAISRAAIVGASCADGVTPLPQQLPLARRHAGS